MQIQALPLLSKVSEQIIYNQLGKYMETFLNRLLHGFRKAHSTQHALSKLLQWWQKKLDNSELVGKILMDFSKAFDCLPHDLIIAKFEGYSLSKSRLTSHKERGKIDLSYIWWNKIKRCHSRVYLISLCYLMFLLMIFLCLLRKVRFAILLMIIPMMTVAKTYQIF